MAGIILDSKEVHSQRLRSVPDAKLSDSLQVWFVKHLDWIKNFLLAFVYLAFELRWIAREEC